MKYSGMCSLIFTYGFHILSKFITTYYRVRICFIKHSHCYRLLPGKDLLSAALVNKRWIRIIKRDRKLRQKIRRHIRQDMKARRAAVLYGTRRPSREQSVAAVPVRNSQYSGERGK